jgi:hypothetical protein
MPESPHKKSNAAVTFLQPPAQDAPSGYIFSEETVQSLQALGEILRRIHNRLKTEKAAAIGVEGANNGSMKK